MNTDWTAIYTCKECHKTEYRWNHTATDHKQREQWEDGRNVGENSCNSADGTDQTGPIIDVYDDDDDDDDEVRLTKSTRVCTIRLNHILQGTDTCSVKDTRSVWHEMVES